MSDKTPDPAATTPRHVLLVEDDDDAIKGLARLLEIQGYRVTQAADGASALAALGREAPDVLLTDVQLPDLDGRELARRARDRHPGLRIALITGWDVPGGPDDLAAMGVDGVLLKPVQCQELVDWIEGRTPP